MRTRPILALEPETLSITPMPAIDQTRRLYQVEPGDATVSADLLLARGDAAVAAIQSATRLATVAACAELVGAMGWIMRQSVEYAKGRRQFGKPIGAFQAVAHRCADMLLYLETARSAAYYAAWAVSVDNPAADRLVSVAKAWCSDVARKLANSGIQVHGGIGFTWEHDLQLYYKRVRSDEILFGDATYHRERVARLVLD